MPVRKKTHRMFHVEMAVLMVIGLGGPNIALAQDRPSSVVHSFAYCVGDGAAFVYTSDIFEVDTASAIDHADEDWRAYLSSAYRSGRGHCQAAHSTSKAGAYAELDAAATKAQHAANAAGQGQVRRTFHTGWRAGQ